MEEFILHIICVVFSTVFTIYIILSLRNNQQQQDPQDTTNITNKPIDSLQQFNNPNIVPTNHPQSLILSPTPTYFKNHSSYNTTTGNQPKPDVLGAACGNDDVDEEIIKELIFIIKTLKEIPIKSTKINSLLHQAGDLLNFYFNEFMQESPASSIERKKRLELEERVLKFVDGVEDKSIKKNN